MRPNIVACAAHAPLAERTLLHFICNVVNQTTWSAFDYEVNSVCAIFIVILKENKCHIFNNAKVLCSVLFLHFYKYIHGF